MDVAQWTAPEPEPVCRIKWKNGGANGTWGKWFCIPDAPESTPVLCIFDSRSPWYKNEFCEDTGAYKYYLDALKENQLCAANQLLRKAAEDFETHELTVHIWASGGRGSPNTYYYGTFKVNSHVFEAEEWKGRRIQHLYLKRVQRARDVHRAVKEKYHVPRNDWGFRSKSEFYHSHMLRDMLNPFGYTVKHEGMTYNMSGANYTPDFHGIPPSPEYPYVVCESKCSAGCNTVGEASRKLQLLADEYGKGGWLVVLVCGHFRNRHLYVFTPGGDHTDPTSVTREDVVNRIQEYARNARGPQSSETPQTKRARAE